MLKESKTNNPNLLNRLMKARELLDDCINYMKGSDKRKVKSKPLQQALRREIPASPNLDFEANERAFIRANARGLSGPKKFVLLLAFLTKGKINTGVGLQELESHWNKMTASQLLKYKFNRKYTTLAKESGWVDSRKKGVYFLRPSWKEIFR